MTISAFRYDNFRPIWADASRESIRTVDITTTKQMAAQLLAYSSDLPHKFKKNASQIKTVC